MTISLVFPSQNRIIGAMFKISEPDDFVYYIEDLTVSGDGRIDPMKPFKFWCDANDYARDEMKLQVDEFNIISWKVD
jgi:hypothetical protein